MWELSPPQGRVVLYREGSENIVCFCFQEVKKTQKGGGGGGSLLHCYIYFPRINPSCPPSFFPLVPSNRHDWGQMHDLLSGKKYTCFLNTNIHQSPRKERISNTVFTEWIYAQWVSILQSTWKFSSPTALDKSQNLLPTQKKLPYHFTLFGPCKF